MKHGLFLEETAVIGGGLMGAQIALVLALGSKSVHLMSRRRKTLDRAEASIRRYCDDLHRHDRLGGDSPADVAGRIHTTTGLKDALVDSEFIVESITEDFDAKQALFAEIDRVVPSGIPIASNTSGLPISQLAKRAAHPGRIAGSHFVQPAHIVPVVEVVSGEKTSEETLRRIETIWGRLGWIPLRVQKDIPGFLINRLQHAVIREAVNLLIAGVATVEDIDLAFRLGLAPRFTTAGPLEQRDINGLGTHVRVAGHLWKTLGGSEEPLAYLRKMVGRGETGLEAGKGYYDWGGQDPVQVRRVKDELLLRRTREVMDDWKSGADWKSERDDGDG